MRRKWRNPQSMGLQATDRGIYCVRSERYYGADMPATGHLDRLDA